MSAPVKQWVWRYRPTGKERHLLAHPDAARPVCAATAWSPGGWLGAANPEQQDQLLRLPMCRRCLRRQAERS